MSARRRTAGALAPRRHAPARRSAARAGFARVLADLVVVGAVVFVVGVILGLAVVGRHGGGAIQSWDQTVWSWSVHHRGSLVGVSKWIGTYLDAAPLAVICIVLTLAMLAVTRSIRGLVPIVAYLGGEADVFVTREIIHRHRPPTAGPSPLTIPGVHDTSWSYPSGHAVAVTAVLFALLGLAALTYHLWWPWVLALAGSLFVADSRLVLGVHWFSDVAFGLVLGVVWGIAVARAAWRLGP